MKRPFLQVVILSLAGVIFFGVAVTIVSVSVKEDQMRQDLITDARIVSAGVFLEDLNQLNGSIADLNSSAYNRIKQYLSDVVKKRPQSRFVYLLSKNPEGDIIFLADSEPESSFMSSYPGQPYPEASDLIRNLFVSPEEAFEGPLPDRWGRWVTGLVPIFGTENKEVSAVLGIDVDASSWEKEIFFAILIPVIITILISLIVIILLFLWMRKERESEMLLRAEEEARVHAKELATQNEELKRVKDELAALTADLERRISEGTTEIQTLNEELRNHSKKVEGLLVQKDQFIYQLAHDLRTPLTPMVAILPLVQEAVHDPESQYLLDMFQKSLRYMEQMVENILELIRLNGQHTIDDFEEIILKDLIDEEIRSQAFLSDEKEIVFSNEVPSDISLCLSRVYSHQLFRNLINNAVKFNAFKGTVTVRYKETPFDHVITIHDTGIGISPDNLSRIWDEFFIADSSRHDPESKGLGLSIVRKIVTLHGGTITAESPGIGKGTTVTITLPKRQKGKR